MRIKRTAVTPIITGRSLCFFEFEGNSVYLFRKYYSFNCTGLEISEDNLEKILSFASYNAQERVIDELTRKTTEQANSPPFQ